jgi:hypothetical protein
LAIVQSGSAKKGDVLGIARIAGIQAAKKTSDLIPLCHPLPITKVAIDLALQPAGEPMEVTSPHGGSFIWTRKDPIRAVGRVTVNGRTREIDHAGLIDASAGYHARATAWRRSSTCRNACCGDCARQATGRRRR